MSQHPTTTTLKDVFSGVGFPHITLVYRSDHDLWQEIVALLERRGAPLCVSGVFRCGKTTLVKAGAEAVGLKPASVTCTSDLDFSTLMRKIVYAFPPTAVDRFLEKVRVVPPPLVAVVKIVLTWFGVPVSLQGSSNTETRFDRSATAVIARQLIKANAVLILDDFHRLSPELMRLVGELLKEWTDVEADGKALQVVLIGSDASPEGLQRLVTQHAADLRGRLSELKVGLMEERDLRQILEKGAKALNITFATAVKDGIIRHSLGFPGDCHEIARACCEEAGVRTAKEDSVTITEAHFEKALASHYRHINPERRERIEFLLEKQHSQRVVNALRYFLDVAHDSLQLEVKGGEPDFRAIANRHAVETTDVQMAWKQAVEEAPALLTYDRSGQLKFGNEVDLYVYSKWRSARGGRREGERVLDEMIRALKRT